MLLRDFIANRIVKFVGSAVILAALYLIQPYRPVVFLGQSMSPTYRNYEFALGTTDTSHLKRGDVVVLDTPKGQIVKRVAYMPGEWVDGFFYYGNWTYASDAVIVKNALKKSIQLGRAFVPGGYVFVTGDNADISCDSRQLGVFPINSIRCVLLHAKPFGSELAVRQPLYKATIF